MGNWHQILLETQREGSTHDIVRRKYLKRLQRVTKRNVIAYYSGWLQKPDAPDTGVSDSDKNGLMSVVHKLDRTKGLDLLLHTPGGDLAATESIVDYLRSMFGTDIRAIVPQLAMSAGTMIACACREIWMGKHSSLGPIDPQLGGVPAQGVVEEFKKAVIECKEDPDKIPLWQPIIANYSPTLLGECQKAMDWGNQLADGWLKSGMFADRESKEELADQVLAVLGSHTETLSHSRHLSADRCRELGLKVEMFEDDDGLQEAVLSVHHTFIQTLTATGAYKIIQNHIGTAFIQMIQKVVVRS